MATQDIRIGTLMRPSSRMGAPARQLAGLVDGQQVAITAIVPENVYGRKAYKVKRTPDEPPDKNVLVWAGQLVKVPDDQAGPPWTGKPAEHAKGAP